MSKRVGLDPCMLARRWSLDPLLAQMLVDLDRRQAEEVAAAGLRWPGLTVVSGFRSRRTQARVNPLAPNSLHTRCPALAADLRVGNQPASLTPFLVWKRIGRTWQELGGGWGGNFKTPDVNHFECRQCGAPPIHTVV